MRRIHPVHEAQFIPSNSRGMWVHGDTGTWGSIMSWRSSTWCGGGGSESTKEGVIVDEGANRMPRMPSRIPHVAHIFSFLHFLDFEEE